MSQTPPEPENTPNPLPPQPLTSNQFVDEISGIDDSDTDDDLSHVLDPVTTIPIPQSPEDVKILRLQTDAKHKAAIQKFKLADADFREAVLKAKICRNRVQQAKHLLDATNVYCHHVDWVIQESKYKDVLSEATTVTDSGQHDTKVYHIVNTPGGSMAVILD